MAHPCDNCEDSDISGGCQNCETFHNINRPKEYSGIVGLIVVILSALIVVWIAIQLL